MTYNPFSWFWIVAGDDQRAFSSAAAAYIDVAQADPDRTTHIGSEHEMIAVLRAANVPPYHRVAKSTILSRLGKEDSERAFALTTIDQQLRWNAPDKPSVNADDPETIAIIAAVGADASVVLAPESQ